MAKVDIPTITRNTNLSASKQLWDTFNEWWRKQGCTSLTEGLRTAMRIVTNFDGQNQGNFTQINNGE